MEDFASLEYLATTAGTVAFVTIVTQYIKGMLPEKFSIRLFVLLLCLVIQMGLVWIICPSTEAFILAFVNSFVCATSARGTYEATVNKDGYGSDMNGKIKSNK